MDEKKIKLSHMCGNGTMFKCETLNLSTVVYVEDAYDIPPMLLNADFMEFGAWHGLQIYDKLQSFQGYDTVEYELVK